MNENPKHSKKSNVRGYECTGRFEIIVVVSVAYNFQTLTCHERRACWSCWAFCSIDSISNNTFWYTHIVFVVHSPSISGEFEAVRKLLPLNPVCLPVWNSDIPQSITITCAIYENCKCEVHTGHSWWSRSIKHGIRRVSLFLIYAWTNSALRKICYLLQPPKSCVPNILKWLHTEAKLTTNSKGDIHWL
jgi:hypothetical protein